jgi:hypothetical protein
MTMERSLIDVAFMRQGLAHILVGLRDGILRMQRLYGSEVADTYDELLDEIEDGLNDFFAEFEAGPDGTAGPIADDDCGPRRNGAANTKARRKRRRSTAAKA